MAARYAGALKVSGEMSSGEGERPTVMDIWLWKLEEVACRNFGRWKSKQDGTSYDHLVFYAHQYCLKSIEDVRSAPDSVLLEALWLPNVECWGWLYFMVRELGWFGMIANNWGWPILNVGEDIKYSNTSEEQRRRQAVFYFLELMRSRGLDPLAQVRRWVEIVKAKFKGIHKRELTEEELSTWVRKREWLSYIYLYGDKPNHPSALTVSSKPKYGGDTAAQLAGEIRAAAERRRAVWNAPHNCDCAEREQAELLEKERVGIEKTLKMLFPPPDVGIVPDGKLLETLCSLVRDTYDAREGKFAPPHASQRLEIFLAKNEKVRELLRLPEHRALALIIKWRVLWLYIAPDAPAGRLPCKMWCEDCKRDPLHNLAAKYPPTAADVAMRVRQFA